MMPVLSVTLDTYNNGNHDDGFRRIGARSMLETMVIPSL